MGIINNENGKSLNMAGVTPTVASLTLTLANTEYGYKLPVGTTAFTIQARTSADVKMATTALASGTTYMTVKAGASYSQDSLTTEANLYFQTASAGTVMEIISWGV